MADLPLQLLPGWQSALTVAALVTSAIALVVAVATLRRERRLADHYEAIMTGAEGVDLAAALEAVARRADGSEARLASLEARAAGSEGRLRRALRHVRVLRYSAFQDAGGDQSYAVALLDDEGDGAVMSALVSRTGTRAFAKPVSGGRSEFPLTNEEQQAIEEALATPPDR